MCYGTLWMGLEKACCELSPRVESATTHHAKGLSYVFSLLSASLFGIPDLE
jgi:hypothetical protein